MSLDAERRAALLGAKLGALVASVAPGERRPATFPGGAALVDDGEAWVLLDAKPARGLGPALAWCRAARADRLHVVTESHAGSLARRASQFADPPTVWKVDGRSLVRAEPEPLAPAPPIAHDVAAWADLFRAAGCEPLAEHGRLIGEVDGLEVARVSPGPDGPRLEIGVGRFDREAHALVSSGRPTQETLAEVVALVRRQRRAEGVAHPLRRLARERWLRARLVERPDLVGAELLAPVPSLVEQPDLDTAWPAVAAGLDDRGEPLVVACSVGIDLDLVPFAADARLADGRGAQLVLVLPPRDAHPVTHDLAALLAAPARLVTIRAT